MKEKDLEGYIDLEKISRATSGFVEADLVALVDKASNIALNRIIDGTEMGVSIKNADTKEKKTGGKTWHEVLKRWENSASQCQILSPLLKDKDSRVFQISSGKTLEEDGTYLETRFLLYRPPGYRKTLIAEAVANEARANFIHIMGASFTQGMVSSIPIGGSISPEGFLLLIMLLVVIIIAVVIVVVILIVVVAIVRVVIVVAIIGVVVVVGGVFIIKLSFGALCRIVFYYLIHQPLGYIDSFLESLRL
uniref:ATPase AAA-type core domain-containing protein n=1 Tax=Tanacetum cinerariifolium TaxID=118510 RepID=A0A6L2K3W4_TANCI|nr:hypothetical protein [Tanacetum cinerariifolium]